MSGLTITGGQNTDGGGIYNAGTLTVCSCTISRNFAGEGAGIYNAGTLTVINSTVSLNSGGYGSSGAGIYNDYAGSLTLTGSTIAGNAAGAATPGGSGGDGNGGGLYSSGTATLTDCTISSNSADGVPSDGSGYGGGIENQGTLTVVSCTISRNSAGAAGGLEAGAGRVDVANTIIAYNSTPTFSADPDVYGAFNVTDHDLIGVIGDATGFVSGGPNASLVGAVAAPINPNLGPLVSNGGPTQTMAVLAGSPAIDAGDNSPPSPPFTPVSTDQRGFARITTADPAVDIGAFELLPFALTATEGVGLTAAAAFGSPEGGASSTDFTASITWGDGATTSGSVSGDATNGFTVSGTHDYAEEATSLPVSVVLQGDSISETAQGSVSVADAALTATGVTLKAAQGTNFNGTVATFTDVDPAGTSADYTAAINWGDGATTAGAITTTGAGFAIAGSHTYSVNPTQPVDVTVADSGGSRARAVSTTTNTWTGGGDGTSWNDPANWSEGIPTALSGVSIGAGATVNLPPGGYTVGNLKLATGAALEFTLDGTQAGTGYGVLDVEGAAILSGIINVAMASGCTPNSYDTYQPVLYGNESGAPAINVPTGDDDFLTPTSLYVVPAGSGSLTVANTADSGSGSLRAAIIAANNSASPVDLVTFDIPTSDPGYSSATGVWTISPASALPAVTAHVIIDATTQPGYLGQPVIQLSGANAGSADGLDVTGGHSRVSGLAINGFANDGIQISGAGYDTLTSNYVGTNPAGSYAVAYGGNGVMIDNTSDNTIGGTTAAAANVISGNGLSGVVITGPLAAGNTVEGNRIGTNAAGTTSVGNQADGVRIVGNASQNVIGGTTTGAGNLVSGNRSDGIDLGSSQAGVLVPAYFYPGTGGSGGSGDGWGAMTAAAAQIPVTAIVNPDSGPLPGPADPNYVTALTNLENAGGKVVAYIATDYGNTSLATVEGEAATYISQYGKLIEGFFIDEMTNDNNSADLTYYHSLYTYLKGLSANYEVIGNPGAPTQPGYLAPATQGADVLMTFEKNDQSQPYANSPPYSWVFGYPASDFANTIYNQGTAAGMSADVNTAASYNAGYVYVTDQSLPNPYGQLPTYWNQEVAAIHSAFAPAATTNTIQGNFVGTDASGAKAISNGGNGISITDASGNSIGGSAAGAANTIAFNTNDGVLVDTGVENLISQNSIFFSGHLGIELINSGNASQAAPVMTSVTASAGSTTVTGSVTAAANTIFTLEFFASAVGNPSGFGEGQTFLGAGSVTTNASGVGNFSLTLPVALPADQPVISATATDPSNSTSQFSNDKNGYATAVAGDNNDDQVELTAQNDGAVGFQVTSGGTVVDSGTIAAGTSVLLLNLGAGSTVTVNGTAGDDTFALSLGKLVVNGVTLDASGVNANIASWQLNGLAGDDTFAVNGAVGTMSIDGGSGANAIQFASGSSLTGTVAGSGITLDYSGYGAAVSVDLTTGAATATGGVSGITTVVLGDGASSVTGDGTTTLVGPHETNTWNLNSATGGTIVYKKGSVTTTITYAGIANLVGGAGNDTFQPVAGVLPAGSIDGGAGTNTLTFIKFTSTMPLSVDLHGTADTVTSAGSTRTFANIESIVGDASTGNTLTGPATASTWTLTAASAGKVGGISFSKFPKLVGWSGSDTLIGPNLTNTWAITAPDAGSVAKTAFSGMANLIGGTGNDVFQLKAGGSVSGTIDGGTGTGINTLDYTNYFGTTTGSGVTVDLVKSTADGIAGGFSDIQIFKSSKRSDTLSDNATTHIWTLTGSEAGTVDAALTFSAFEHLIGSGGDTLTGANATATWVFSGTNAGSYNTKTLFVGMANIVGGTGADTFKFNNAAMITGSLDGGGGTDTVNYAAYSTAVVVNLADGSATGVDGGADGMLKNIENATGGKSTNVLIGDAAANVLIGGEWRNVIIGGGGVNTLTAGPGQDLLIAGTTSFDMSDAELALIAAEWFRTDRGFAARVADLSGTGTGGLNGSVDLISDLSSTGTPTVFDNAATDTLSGNAGTAATDWFFAGAGDVINNGIARDETTDI